MLDSIGFEKAGVPTVLVCCHAFVKVARLQAKAMGYPDLGIVGLDDQLPWLSKEQAELEVRRVVPEIIELLCPGAAPVEGGSTKTNG